MKTWNYLIVVCLFLFGCAQTGKNDNQPTPDEVVLDKGLKVLSDSNVKEKDAALAAFKEACELGNNYGCHKTGIAFNNGLYGLDKDYQQAKQWYFKAAEKGYIPSQQNIANLYAHRLLENLDDIEGYKWLKLAEAGTARCAPGTIEFEGNISDDERRRLCQLAIAGQGRIRSIFRKRMTVEEIQKAEQLALKWKAKK